MLLLIALTLKGCITVSPTPVVPAPSIGIGAGGNVHSISNKASVDNGKYTYDYKAEEERIRKERLEKILIEDSELIQIVELTLKNFII